MKAFRGKRHIRARASVRIGREKRRQAKENKETSNAFLFLSDEIKTFPNPFSLLPK